MDRKESTVTLKMENQNHNQNHHVISYSNQSLSSLPIHNDDEDDEQKSSSLGFMELLGFQDFTTDSSSSIFENMHQYQYQYQLPSAAYNPLKEESNHDDDRKVNDEDEVGEEESSVVLNGQPSSPNSSSISSPSAATVQKPLKQCMKAKTKTKMVKKKEARFAFMTRTEIDHLDDGYRWRKYGQKAVKNSPFPRSYYRCTSASCNVKKRVERCMGDPAMVVTTYEGQHVHPSPSTPFRSPMAAYSFEQYCQTTHMMMNNNNNNTKLHNIICMDPTSTSSSSYGGLLQDMVPSSQQYHI